VVNAFAGSAVLSALVACLARVLLACVLLAPAAGWPHATQLSSSRLELIGNRAGAVLELNGRDLEVALQTGLTAADGVVAPERLDGAAVAISDYLLQHVRLANRAGGACQGAIESLRARGEHVLAQMRWHCPPLTGTLVYRVTLFHEVDPAARHMLTVSGDVRRMALLSNTASDAALLQTRAQVLQVLSHYLLAGMQHIVTGGEHIAFIVALILWGRRVWPLVGVVTAFTLAHSVTLTLAVLDLVTLPAKLVETFVAVSIVYVAAENFWVRDLRRRWWLAGLFGLVHGFGFASVLRDYGLPRDALLPTLAAVNAGVELGQIAVVLGVISAFVALRVGGPGCEPNRRVLLGVSGAILLLGLYWSGQALLAMR
jgi:hydrogenase/urease accessory protein HupE